jgi:phosphate transport system protein
MIPRISRLKKQLLEMWVLVESQLEHSRQVLVSKDLDVSLEIIHKEEKVDAYELLIDREVKKIFLLYTPTSHELKFLILALKLSSSLEKIGDIAEDIAESVLTKGSLSNVRNFQEAGIIKLYDNTLSLLADTRRAFSNENSIAAVSIGGKKLQTEQITHEVNHKIAVLIANEPDTVHEALFALSVFRFLERAADLAGNIEDNLCLYSSSSASLAEKI